MEAPADAFPGRLPFTLGHENAGWVEKLGPGATGFAPGDPVIVYGPWGCGTCANCRGGMENYWRTPAASVAAWAETTAGWLHTCSSRRHAS
jgi:propanol-preferring alcohol dehydrogenase